ncbi:MAG: hypothetical protein PF692_08125 [Kiritimatiellae bacterium]|jgi:DNA-directed RNA polymerase subunit RPC12/RpoP|nr:hypothetical protein [Kiritimatiellia bacterium]
MADIKINCKKCDKELSVSEYADEVICSACGHAFVVKDPDSIAKVMEEKRQILKERSDSGSEGIPQSLSVNEILRKTASPKKKSSVHGTFNKMLIIFAVVGLISYMLRYTEIFPAELSYMLKNYMPWTFVVLHFLIIFAAFKDNVFDGTLTLLLPPYAYYYLIFKSDEYVFKAIYLGLLVGYGGDFMFWVVDKNRELIRIGNKFLDGGYE